jgi:hypothetical protein
MTYFLFLLELSTLHEKKRNRVADFKEEQAQYAEYRDQRKKEVNKIRQQEKQAVAHAKAEERLDYLIP